LEAPPTGTFLADQEIERPVAGYEGERKKKEVERNGKRSGQRHWFEEWRTLRRESSGQEIGVCGCGAMRERKQDSSQTRRNPRYFSNY